MIDELALAALCERLLALIASGKRLSMVAAVCETGADPKLLREAFTRLDAQGQARLIGGDNRGWVLARAERVTVTDPAGTVGEGRSSS